MESATLPLTRPSLNHDQLAPHPELRGSTGEGRDVELEGVDQLVPQNVVPPGRLTLDLDHRKIVAYNAPDADALATDDSYRHGTHTSASVVGDDLAHPAAGSAVIPFGASTCSLAPA